MPRALAVDWHMIESLFIAGIPNRDICLRTGVTPTALRARACRGKWKQRRSEINEAVQRVAQAQQSAKGESASVREGVSAEDIVEDWADRLTRMMMGRIETIVDTLPIEAKSLAVLNTAVEIVAKISGEGKRVIRPEGNRLVDLELVRDAEEALPTTPEPPAA
ncbi:MAG TPA: hypothetical protein VJ063_12565 [Verrucomicrobiae bacterium]|nr:hypothetical protein [Verrucomicrobiae bacterium]